MVKFVQNMEVNINDVPDVLILHIFKHLTTKEICISSRVCRRWNKISYDKSLWRDIDISGVRLNLRKAWKFYRARLSDCLKCMKIQGNYHNRATLSQKKPVLSDALLEDLRSNCPNIHSFTIEYADLKSISASKLPQSLESLSLVSCGMFVDWLSGLDLPHLQCLELIKCASVDDNSIKGLGKLTSLERLRLVGLYRLKDAGIQYLSENLPQLTHLDVEGVTLHDIGIHHVCRHMTRLQRLSVTNCCITNTSIQTIAVSLPNLNYLDISHNKIDQNCLKSIFSNKNLQTLVCTIDPDTIDEDLKNKLSNQFMGTVVNNFRKES